MRKAWSDAEKARMLAMRAEGRSCTEIAEAFGSTKNAIECLLYRLKASAVEVAEPGERSNSTSWETFGDHQATFTAVTTEPVHTLEDLKRICNIDTEVWEAERLVCNAWSTAMKGADGEPRYAQNYQVKAFLRKRFDHLECSRRLAEYTEKAEAHSPHYMPVPRTQYLDRKAAVVCLFDSHLNKLAWPEEVGGGPAYDLKIAVEIYKTAFLDLLGRIEREGVEKIVYVIGNDFLNIDNPGNTTTRGTIQHSDTRFQKAYGVGFDLLVWAIDLMRSVAKVLVMSVPGNHDATVTWTITHALQAWYRRDPEVAFNNEAAKRKYWLYGSNLICMDHGDDVKPKDLPLVMAAERPHEWAKALYREVYTGHLHQRGLSEHKGVLVRICPSLSATDAWHFNSGYVCNRRAAEAYIYRHDGALCSVLHYDVPPVAPPALIDAA